MQYYRCKCGEHQFYGSGMLPAKCSGCSKCGTNLAQDPDHHKRPEPHHFVIRYDEHTGKPYEICDQCYRRKDRMEPLEANNWIPQDEACTSYYKGPTELYGVCSALEDPCLEQEKSHICCKDCFLLKECKKICKKVSEV